MQKILSHTFKLQVRRYYIRQSQLKDQGIHGLPYERWPNQEWNNDIPKKPIQPWFGGFCTHSSILFLTWHRPYLALFEVGTSQEI